MPAAVNGVIAERKQQAQDLLDDVVRLHRALVDVKARIAVAVEASKTSVTDVYGVGPVGAAIIVGHAGNVDRFASRNHFASYNATAPIEASSGPTKRHRLNQRGNRQLNHAMHIAAITQIRNDTPGRAYYQRKIGEGQDQEGSDARVETQDQRRRLPPARHRRRPLTAGPGGQPGATLTSSAAGIAP